MSPLELSEDSKLLDCFLELTKEDKIATTNLPCQSPQKNKIASDLTIETRPFRLAICKSYQWVEMRANNDHNALYPEKPSFQAQLLIGMMFQHHAS